MFSYPLVTKQTGEEGQKVSKVLVVRKRPTSPRSITSAWSLDRAIGLPVLMACAEGGVEIEEVAARSPEKILKTPVDPDAGLQPFQARRLAYRTRLHRRTGAEGRGDHDRPVPRSSSTRIAAWPRSTRWW